MLQINAEVDNTTFSFFPIHQSGFRVPFGCTVYFLPVVMVLNECSSTIDLQVRFDVSVP